MAKKQHSHQKEMECAKSSSCQHEWDIASDPQADPATTKVNQTCIGCGKKRRVALGGWFGLFQTYTARAKT